MRNDWTQGTVSVDDGIELFYTRTGNGEKPALVLAHGITDNGLCWHQFASDLEADFDIIMYDAYGHGKSSRVDPNKRFDLIEDLNELINALNLEKPGVIGFSMGAVTAAGFAARYPEKLTALVLEDPPWHEPQDGEKEEEEEIARNQARKKRNLAMKKKTVKELQKLKLKESPNWEEAILPEWAQSKHEFDPKFLDHFRLNGSKWRDLVNAISVPTLIVTGDNELGAQITPSLGVEAIQLLDKGEFGHISSAGHCVRYEQYQPYLTMVQLFLKRNM
jgi:N-formylmaleamate deformylase